MQSFEKLMERMGYVKLDRYGLVRTPDDRILSLRPVVLDDGVGGKIVGWQDGDLAAAELEPWQPQGQRRARHAAPTEPMITLPPTRPPAVPLVSVPAAVTTVTVPLVTVAPATAPVAVTVPAPSIVGRGTAPVTVPRVATVPPPRTAARLPSVIESKSHQVSTSEPPEPPPAAAMPAVEEEDWEWQIVAARARAAADEVSESHVPVAIARHASPAPRAETVHAWVAQTAQTAQAMQASSQPEPVATRRVEPAAIPRVTRPHVSTPPPGPVELPRVAPRATVIPVPTMPALTSPDQLSNLAPVVRSSERRLARGTQQPMQSDVPPPRTSKSRIAR